MEGADDRNGRGAGKGRRWGRGEGSAATDGAQEACESGRAQLCNWRDRKASAWIPAHVGWQEGEERAETGEMILIATLHVLHEEEGGQAMPSHRTEGEAQAPGASAPGHSEIRLRPLVSAFCTGSVDPSRLRRASTSLDGSEVARPQHIQKQPQGFLPPKPNNYTEIIANIY